MHNNDLGHEDGCDICVVVHNFHSADIPPATIELPLVECHFCPIVLHDNYPPKHSDKGFYSTAPPAY